MSLELVTDASIDPVDRDDAKAHISVEHDKHNGYIDGIISIATRFVQKDTWRQFIEANMVLRLKCFPTKKIGNPHGEIFVPKPPLIRVNSVKYRDTDGVQQTLAASKYDVDTYSEVGRIKPAHNETWPSIRPNLYDSVEVDFDCGYGTAATDVPVDLRHCIKFMIAQWYDRRGPVSFVQGLVIRDIPKTYDDLVEPFRVRDVRLLEFIS